MASINKLSIRGVRAFNPEDSEQVVEFYCPMTFIVGANGCGKTTIIECLKYAITGSYPPGMGGRTGASFVHDCKAIDQTTVKANVKLRFTSRASQSMVVVRSMELTQKKSKATFKQLDGVLRMMDPDTGEKISLSHKCSELDKELPQLLGVSKAILEHVIFCHQEEASWPLEDSAGLKKRFDDIFDSTKYSKALKVFRETEKDFNSKVKDLKAELAGYAAHKQAAEGFQNEMADQKEALESVEEMKNEIEQKVSRVEAQEKQLVAIIDEADDVDIRIQAIKTELEQKKAVAENQQSSLENDLTKTHSLSDLKEMLSNFRSKMSEQERELEELDGQYKQLGAEIEKGRNEEKALTSDLGKLTAEKEAHEKQLRERFNKMEHIAQSYNLDLTQMSQSQSQNVSFVAATLSQSMAGEYLGDDETLIPMSADDMQSFFQELEGKETNLRAEIKELRKRNQAEEDKITSEITELGGRQQAIENDRNRLFAERRDVQKELKELNDAAMGYSRTRKTDVEDARRNAKRMAEERELANNDPRRTQIPLEIRQIEDKMDKLKRKIEDESMVLEALKQTADSQNALTSLREQCEKDFEALEENIRDETYSLTKFNIPVPTPLPNEGDEEGEGLRTTIEAMLNGARSKHDAANGHFRSASEDAVKSQKIVSEKTALLANSQRSLTSIRAKLQATAGSVEEVRKLVDALRTHEENLGESTLPPSATEESPREILEYLSERLEAVEESAMDASAAEIAKKILKKLRKMAKTEDGLQCPCCKRDMDDAETGVFQQGIQGLQQLLVDPDSGRQEEDARLKETYQSMRKTIESCMDDLNDFRRLTGEEADVEKEIKKHQDEITRYTSTLKEHNETKDEAQTEVDELRLLIDLTRRWSDDATRIMGKKLQIHQKKLDLSASTAADTSRDLKTVDRAVSNLREEKESLSTKIAELNKEMTNINRKISDKSTAAAKSEKLCRDKEERYAVEMQASDRKKQLQERIKAIDKEEVVKSDLITPIMQKRTKKESVKQRQRALANEQEQEKMSTLSLFQNDFAQLRTIVDSIEAFEQSSKPQDLQKIQGKVDKIVSRINAKKKEQEDLHPKVESVRRAVEDQGRYKTNLQQNIDILGAGESIKVLEKDIADQYEKRRNIEGVDTAHGRFQTVKAQREELLQKKARCDGLFSSHVEQIRALQRKLKGEDYKDVFEQYRVCNIKTTTTKYAAEDLKKYANAMDKALLQFHSVKIREINKIIRELWLLTYKGEDILNIEIQSGQEPGSKAAKSYNYRVVMSKGGAKMDMRGRCSAGQRVLASIVIRLALAETFGVNCGCIALDEPTVNLDAKNKEGLAKALAQIVASRSHQRNFQLILITHDQAFVLAMKNELATLTGFSMPEKYFQVCREENEADGKYYSKINAVDWDELV